ncbi:MAG: DUF2254 domain-containing protein [Archangium sp.]|nr:DUF2254 domain-containing protein [Archangium sp.]MDP3571459.1 DUF2254 domain-containing protein [Archangium sp.]
MNKVKALWAAVRDSFWAVPSLIVLASVGLAIAAIELEPWIEKGALEAWPRLFGAGADGARGMLSAIATSMITVAGVVFSITIVALSLASSQYSSRVLRNFIRDRVNQVVLGVFLGIFAYCLVVLRTIRGGDVGPFVPGLAVLGAVVLAFVGIGVLILFIHHIGTSIQASHIIALVSDDTARVIEQLFPEGAGEPASELPDEARFATPQPLLSQTTGYIQRVELEELLTWAREQQRVVRLERGVGEFVIEGTPLAALLDARSIDEATVAAVNRAFTIDRQRTVDQDAGYGIRQLVDVALKGLSPGVNDVTTAIMCANHLTAILARLGARHLAWPARGASGRVWVIARRPGYADFLAEAFDQIRQNAQGNVAMLRHLVRCFATLGQVTLPAERRGALFAQLEAVIEVIGRTVNSPVEREVLGREAAEVAAKLST